MEGYPGDKSYGSRWKMVDEVDRNSVNNLYYPMDTFGGQSGSPVYGKVSNTCQTCAFGIHAYATGLEPFPGSNSGTRVTDALFADLALWTMP
mgnify:CR=1 FL=1